MDIHVITIHMFKRLNHPDEKVYPPKIYRYYESMVSLIWSKKLDIGPRIWKFQNTLMVKITKMDTIGIWVCRLSSGDIYPRRSIPSLRPLTGTIISKILKSTLNTLCTLVSDFEFRYSGPQIIKILIMFKISYTPTSGILTEVSTPFR